MNRAVSGTVAALETGRPLPGLTVVAGRLLGGRVELLGCAVTEQGGVFRIQYPRLAGPADLVLMIYDPDGDLLYTEPPHRSIDGAELNLRVEIPLAW